MWITLLARFWYLIPIALLTASTGWYRHEAAQEHAQRIQIAAEYQSFISQVDALGKAQEARNRETLAQQEKVNRETVKSADARVTSILDRYRLLAQQTNTRGGSVPPDAAAPKPVNDPARDAELLTVLRQAEIQTGQLIELQGWIKNLPK